MTSAGPNVKPSTNPNVKESVQQHFGAAAADYAESWPHRSGPDLAAMLEAAALTGDEAALDVGCGAGHTAFGFAERCARVVAIDLTDAMLEQTRSGAADRGLTQLEARAGDAEAMPFPSESFDRVSCRLAAHHFPHAERFVAEALRVLRPGGRLLLSDSVSPEDHAQDSYLNTIEVLRDPSHVRNHRVSQWLAMFDEAGFENARTHGSFPCPLDFKVWTERMKTPPDACAGLRAVFRAAPAEIREAFAIASDASAWQLDIAVLSADKPSG